MIDADLANFLQSGLSIVVGTRDADLAPEVARAVGARIDPDGAAATVFVPVATGARTRANLEANGRISVTFSRPADHRTIQIKGGVCELRAADEREREEIERYRAALTAALGYFGVPARLTARIEHWPCHAVRFRVEAVYQQTPGPGAGGALVSGPGPAGS